MPNPLSGVDSWIYYINGVGPAEAAEIGRSQADLVVVDSEDADGLGFTAADVEIMRGGNDKLVISYLSIGEAETYRDYWQDSWATDPPGFLGTENPEWVGNINVRFWDPAWQDIIFLMVDDIVENGFDGLYLDIIDAYAHWEEVEPLPGAQADFYRSEMVAFVAAIRARAEAKMLDMGRSGDFAIIGQNGEDLVLDPDYLAVVDGIGKEDLYFYYPNGEPETFRPVPEGWLTGSQELLEIALAAGVEVFVIEYVPPAELSGAAARLEAELAYLSRLGVPMILADGRALDVIGLSFNSAGLAEHWGTLADDRLAGTRFGDEMHGLEGGDTIRGGRGDDFVFGGRGADRLEGGDGRDSLEGGGGSDRLQGGRGADLLLGGAQGDRLSGQGGRDRLEGGDGWDMLRGGDGDDVVIGGIGNDRLLGGAGNDRMSGGDGADRIDGGSGRDQARGGDGADVFVFDLGDTRMRILDFTPGIDRIDLRGHRVADFAALQDTAHDMRDGVTFWLGPDRLVLSGVTLADLAADDFLF